MTASPRFSQLLRLFKRGTRSQRSGLGLFRLCLILGVASIACAGSISYNLRHGLLDDSRELLGGDVEFSRHQFRIAHVVQAFAVFSGTLSEVAEVRAMVNAGGKRAMVELKGVDAKYPLYGKLRFEGKTPRREIFPRSRKNGQFGAAVERQLLDTLGLKIGDVINIGYMDFEIRAVIAHEPDRIGGGGIFGLGPRVMINMTAFDKTGLSDPTRNVLYRFRIKLPASTDLDEWYKTVQQRFPWAKWNTRDWRQPIPGLGETVKRIGIFLHFSGLTILVTAGIGIASAAAGFINRQQRNIAIYRCLGAKESLIRKLFTRQLADITLQSLAIGLLLGAAAHSALIASLNAYFPLQISTTMSLVPLAIATGYGIAITLLFTAFPLYATSTVRASILLRQSAPLRLKPKGWMPYAIAAGSIAALFGLTYLMTHDLQLTVYYGLAIALSIVALRMASGLLRLAYELLLHRQKLPVSLRLSLLALRRPAAASSFTALGLALSFTVVLLASGHSVLAYLKNNWPERAPAYLVHDLPADEVKNLRDQFAHTEGVDEVLTMPLLSGRIISVRGGKASKAVLEMNQQWAINSPLTVSYSYGPVKNTTLKDGYWWTSDYTGEPLASVTEELAEALNLKIGDKIVLQAQNLELQMEINNIRKTRIANLGMNFDVIATPTGLPGLKQQWIAAIYASPKADNAVQRVITYFFTSQTLIDIRSITARLSNLIGQLQITVWLSALLAVIGSLLVTASALGSNMPQRLYDAVLLKLLGASRKMLHDIRRIEFGTLGITCTLVATFLGGALSYVMLEKLLPESLDFPWAVVPVLLFTATGVLILTGMLATRRVQHVRPMAMLRNE